MEKKNRSNHVRQCKSDIMKGVRLVAHTQVNMSCVEIEGTKDFNSIVTVKTNPAIRLAKRKRVSYTIVKGGEIIEVNGGTHITVGKVARPDVPVVKGKVYKLLK